MAKKKSTRKSSRKSLSKALSAMMSPLDVRSPSMLKEMEKRIRKGPITFVLIYADWCGHCHELMPHWDKATQSPQRSVQAVKVNEKMLSDVNTMVNQSINQQAPPIDVSGYPTIIMVDNKGNQIKDVNPVKDSVVLTRAMNEAGSLAVDAGIASPSASRNLPPPPPLESPSPFPSVDLEASNVSEPSASSFASLQKNIPNENNVGEKSVGEEEEPPLPLPPSMLSQQDSVRPSVSLYSDDSTLRMKDPLKNGRSGSVKGGSLYASMAQTAYQIAPAATLFGMASYVMRKKGKAVRSTRKYRTTRGGRKRRMSEKRRH